MLHLLDKHLPLDLLPLLLCDFKQRSGLILDSRLPFDFFGQRWRHDDWSSNFGLSDVAPLLDVRLVDPPVEVELHPVREIVILVLLNVRFDQLLVLVGVWHV